MLCPCVHFLMLYFFQNSEHLNEHYNKLSSFNVKPELISGPYKLVSGCFYFKVKFYLSEDKTEVFKKSNIQFCCFSAAADMLLKAYPHRHSDPNLKQFFDYLKEALTQSDSGLFPETLLMYFHDLFSGHTNSLAVLFRPYVCRHASICVYCMCMQFSTLDGIS